MKNQRMANIELLRNISMFMVLAIHLFTKTSVLWEMNPKQPVYGISWFLYGLCMTGVNCYVIISGYFLSDSNFRIGKLLKIYVQVWFYSVIISLIAKFILGLEMESGWLAVFLPITNREYWFATVYIGLYCLMPFLNLFIKALSRKQFQRLLAVLAVFFCVIPTILHADSWLEDGGAYGIVWFSFLYLIGAYIKLYNKDERKKKIWLWYAGVILLIPASKFAIMFAGGFQNIVGADKISRISEVFYHFNSIPALCASVLLFIGFLQLKIVKPKSAYLINLLSGTTFGVYLIHNNRNIAHYLWGGVVKIDYWLVERENMLVVILILCAVFTVCGLIEGIRKLLFRVLRLDWMTEKAAASVESLLRREYNARLDE